MSDDTRPMPRVGKWRPKMNQTVRYALAQRYGAERGGVPVDVACVACGRPGQLAWRDSETRRAFDGTYRRMKSTVRLTPPLEWDHVLPMVHGGRHHPDNLQILCQRCNCRKGTNLDWTPR